MPDIEITRREVLLSVAIICVMLVIGLIVSGGISDRVMERQHVYNTAVRVDKDERLFQHCMRTDVGNVLACGELSAVDLVTFPEIGGEYSYIEKVKEKYTRHERIVTRTRTGADGKIETYTEIEVYYSWDRVESWDKHSCTIKFLGVEFNYSAISFPPSHEITTIHESPSIRYVYYGKPASSECTIFTSMRNGTIDDTSAYHGMSIDDVIEMKSSDSAVLIFWILWSVFTAVLVFMFYSLENRWLD